MLLVVQMWPRKPQNTRMHLEEFLGNKKAEEANVDCSHNSGPYDTDVSQNQNIEHN